jgi:peptide/nickel transport system permease protein
LGEINLGNYIGKRLLQLIPILLALSFLVFLLMYISPGDPAVKKLTAQGIAVSQEVLEAEREKMGLNQPFFVRYGNWLAGVLQGDFGLSYADDMPVLPKLIKGMRYTLILATSSLALALAVSIPLGIITAVRSNSLLDHVVRMLTFAGNAMPNFLISVLLMYFFELFFKDLLHVFFLLHELNWHLGGKQKGVSRISSYQ